MAASFAFVEAATANTRQTNDALNGAAGGCAAGFLAGVRGTIFTLTIYSILGHLLTRSTRPLRSNFTHLPNLPLDEPSHREFSSLAGSLPIAVGSCLLLGAAVGTIDVSGGKLTGDGREWDSRDAREDRRQQFFKPRKAEVEAVSSAD